MLIWLAQWLQTLYPDLGFLRVFQYQTFRAVMAALTALLMGLAAGPYVIRRLAELKIGQPIRGYGMESHLSKSGKDLTEATGSKNYARGECGTNPAALPGADYVQGNPLGSTYFIKQ
jgi:hypothetical protein